MAIVYSIVNKINGKTYIGQTSGSLKARWTKHCSENSHCLLLKNAIAKYGKDNFELSILHESNGSVDELERLEIIATNSIYPNGYNLQSGGNRPIHNALTKTKIGKAQLGRKRSKQVRENMSKAALGRVISEQQKIAISNTLLSKLNVRRVVCITNGMTYRSAKQAAKELGVSIAGISLVLNNKQKTTKGLEFRYE